MIDRRLDEMKALGDVAAPPEDAAAADARRRRVVGGMKSAIRRESAARESRAKRTRIIAALAIAATVVLAAGIAWRVGVGTRVPVATSSASIPHVTVSSGTATLRRRGGPQPIERSVDTPVDDDQAVVTGSDSAARLVMLSGATLDLASDTRVGVVPKMGKSERLDVPFGEVTVHVPKLGAEESFRIQTPDVEVVVHGTAFVVTVRDSHAHVRVTEGVVSIVLAGVFQAYVHAGEEWPAPKVETPEPEPPPPPTPSSSAAPVKKRANDPSTLAEQNALLKKALDERRHGDDAHAIQDLDALLARYPGSPLAHEARVEKMRALERSGQHARAVVEARRYLADYPGGFAAEEARGIVVR
jgi:ferric-dicitrate binding protein FerR (iron transport regulator)